jgi:hypothetical protein
MPYCATEEERQTGIFYHGNSLLWTALPCGTTQANTYTYSNIVFPTGAIMTDDKISGIQLRIKCLLIALNNIEFKLNLQIMIHRINAY